MKDKKTLINQEIKSDKVNLIDNNGVKTDGIQLEEALEQAFSMGLDLVQVAIQDDIPVCKIMDFGKHLYEAKKKKGNSSSVKAVKEIYFRPSIDIGDKTKKTNDILRFLEKGHEVKAGIKFKGRELAHKEFGYNILNELKEQILNSNLFKIKSDISSQGRTLSISFSPK